MPPSQYARDQRAWSNIVPPNSSLNHSNRASLTSNAQQRQLQYGQPTGSISNVTYRSSTSANTGVHQAPTNNKMSRRFSSSRSGPSTSPTSYVTLMRKQKATVWCDRAQVEDCRIVDAQRAAKVRAVAEIAGGLHHNGRMSTSSDNVRLIVGIRSKIRLHSAPKASTYTGWANLHGSGVPVRLSASEVDETNSDEEDSKCMHYHRRNRSGMSSLESGPRNNNCSNSVRGCSNYSTPQSRHSPVSSMDDVAEDAETLVPNGYNRQARDYFPRVGSTGSNDAAEAKQSLGVIGGPLQARGMNELERKTSEELRWRTSVEDRAMAMEVGPLYVTNPDLSD